jgi:membrane protein
MLAYLKSTWQISKEIYTEWNDDNCFRHSAAISYYTIFSLAPIILIVITLAGTVFGHEAVSGQIYTQISGLIGKEGGSAVEQLVEASYLEGKSWISTLVSAITLLLSATATFGVLQDSLNTIWDIKVRPNASWLRLIFTRLLSFAVLIGIGAMLIVSLVANAILIALQGYISSLLGPFSVYAIQLVQLALDVGILSVLFALIFKLLPDVRLRWPDVWPASLVTAFLFTIGKFGIGLYLGKSNLASTYGAAASIIIIMLWVNYSAWIFFIGAEYIYVLMRRRGHKIIPSKYAMRVHIREDIDS